MARFHGVVGYSQGQVETPSGSGIWIDQIVEHEYEGDVLENTRQNESGDDKVNKDVTVQNSISIVADDFALTNISNIIYVGWAGALWTVSTVKIRRPRLILALGEVYNGPIPLEDDPPDPIPPDEDPPPDDPPPDDPPDEEG